MSVRCCVAGCDNTNDRYPSKGTFYDGRFLRFPEHPDKRKIWNDIIGSNTIISKFICFEHFTNDDWRYQDIIMDVPLSKRKLKPDAVPSRKLPTTTEEVNVSMVVEDKEEMDEQTRKRLVAEALAEYDLIHSDRQNNPRDRAHSRRLHCPSIDEQTRKRLVAEALAAYETNQNSDGNDNSSSDVKPPTRKKRRNIKAKATEEVEIDGDMDEQTSECVVNEALVEYPITFSESNDNDSSDIKLNIEKESCQNIVMQKCSEDEAPVDEMEIPVKECNFFTNQTLKCGEVILDVDDQTFALNCSLCPGIFLNFLTFSNHIFMQHAGLLQQCNINPLDGNAKDTNKPTGKDLTSDFNGKNAGILQENISIDAISSGDEFQNNYISDSENEECSLTSIEKIPKVQNEANEISIFNLSLVKRVICFLKQNQFSVIWDETHPAYGWYKKRKEAITELITLLLKYFPGLPFTLKNTQSMLTQLRQSYINELIRKLKANQNNELYICNLWCFNMLTFLGEDFKILKRLSPQAKIEHCKKITRDQPLQSLFKLNTPESEEQTIEIIKEYERHPALWNINNPRYRRKFKDYECLVQFQLLIQRNNPKLCFNEQTRLVQLLKHMHEWYTAVETLRQHSLQSNQDFENNFPRIYAALNFLSGNVPPFKCKSCETEFNIEYKYIRHIRDTKCSAPKINSINECQYCQKRFASPTKLKHHMRIHTGERPYTCQKCGKNYRYNHSLYVHKKIHSSKSFKCDECDRAYNNIRSLRIHKKSHLEIHESVCEICGKTFKYQQNLYRHQRLHRESPKFKCKYCCKRFKEFSCMVSHRERCSTLVDSKKRNKKNKKYNSSEHESKTDLVEQNCSKAQSSNEIQTLDEIGKAWMKNSSDEFCEVNMLEQEPLYICEDK